MMGYTREIANVVRLRGLLMRPNILSHIPPTCQAFRECIVKSIPCFKYGMRPFWILLRSSMVGRDENQEYHCIRAEPFGQRIPFVLKMDLPGYWLPTLHAWRTLTRKKCWNYKQGSDHITPGMYTLMRSHSLSVYWKRLMHMCLIYVQNLELWG